MLRPIPILLGLAVIALLQASPGSAGEASVIAVEATPEQDGRWRFAVTVRHADTGWDHYADKWQVLGSDGAVLGERVLLHPHVEEQPFTRSLAGVAIPSGVSEVTVRAHDTVDGWGPPAIVALPDG
jgi:hypothetical protein